MHWTFKISWYRLTIWLSEGHEVPEFYGYYAEKRIEIMIPIPSIYIRQYWLYNTEPDPDDIPF